MRIWTTSLLILAWLVFGFSTFADQLDTGDFGRAPVAIAISDSNDDIEDAKSSEIETRVSRSVQLLQRVPFTVSGQRLKTASIPRYQLISVYRL